jgi:glycosyltransferase involved in cell wall biosynthesis
MEAPKFTFVTPWYGHFAGGAEVAARTLAEQLARRGFDVEVLTTCCRAPFDNWWRNTLPAGVEKRNGVTVRRFPVNTEGEDRYHAMNARVIEGRQLSPAEQRQFVVHTINSDALVQYLRENCQQRIAVGLPFTQGLIDAACRAMPGRFVLMPCLHDEPQALWETTAEMFAAAGGYCFLSDAEQALAIRLFGARLGRRVAEAPVLGVGCELPGEVESLLEDEASLREVRERLKLPERFVVYVGRKDPGKNIAEVIRCMREHRAAGGREELLFLGGGDAALVPHEAGFRDLGFLSERDKYLVMAQAAGLVNLSFNESFSIVVMEAWLTGIPAMVSARSPVTSSHCQRSGGGAAVAASEEFQAVLKIWEHEGARRRMGAAGRQFVRREYAWDAVIDRFLEGAA